MKKASLFLIFAVFSLFGDDSFISYKEYAKMLYKNPRGIGCNKCHGERGEGKIIAVYYIKDKTTKQKIKKELKSPSINNISKIEFFKSFKKKHKVMPTYFLTAKEIESLYYYIKNQNKGRK